MENVMLSALSARTLVVERFATPFACVATALLPTFARPRPRRFHTSRITSVRTHGPPIGTLKNRGKSGPQFLAKARGILEIIWGGRKSHTEARRVRAADDANW